jgi:S-adenosylmethionine:tRNA ribosyltransferase-isomerase
MRVDDFNYALPPELIAQRPADDREAARLMHVGETEITHHTVADLPALVPEGALLVVNDTRVIPARLIGKKAETGGRVEIFLVRKVGERTIEIEAEDEDEHQTRDVEIWRALGKASKALRFDTDIAVGRLVVRLLGRSEDDGLLEVALWAPGGEAMDEAIRHSGHVPLPPYIKREDDDEDTHRYQTVFARSDGAIAAPTAGLHLTHALLGRLAVRGCEVTSVTLHVGLGTFQPVTVEDLDDHPMHAESFVVSRATAEAIARARARGAPVIAVGTTVVRALESAADPEREGHVVAQRAETRLLIQPGHRFRVTDGLLTNFHLPRSTLLAMVCAFAGRERVLAAYARAVEEKYRFFSYGDAMLLWRAKEPA